MKIFNAGQRDLQLSVQDAGPGIAQGDLEKIFDKFTQSKTSMLNSSGTGLGLSICWEIVDLHNGRIWAESPPPDADTGSVFTLEIPLKQVGASRP